MRFRHEGGMALKEQKKRRTALFSDLPMTWKFLLFGLIMLLSVLPAGIGLQHVAASSAREAYRQSEHTAAASAQQLMDLSVSNAVSIAKIIYTDEDLYRFLGKRYSSSSAYYEAYYLLQQDIVMHITDISLFNGFMIYTKNPTVLTGGNIYSFDENSTKPGWLTYFLKSERSSVLYLDPERGKLYFVRQLDYQALDTGDSYLCMELNMTLFREMAGNLDFDGELDIVSGTTLLYSNNPDYKNVEDIVITPAFEAITNNYYTVDMGFYALANRQTFMQQAASHPIELLCVPVMIGLAAATGWILLWGIRKRVRPALKRFAETGELPELTIGANGKDEIGALLDVCCSMSERLSQKDDKFRQSSDSLIRKESDYDTLFSTAMRLDAELAMRRLFPELVDSTLQEEIPLSQELALLQRAAETLGMQYTNTLGEAAATDCRVPVYSLVLMAEDIARHYGGVLVNISMENDAVRILFEGAKIPKNQDILHLLAIFEDGDISDVYDFEKNSRFNPYLRMQNTLGDRADVTIAQKQTFRMVLKLT